VSLPPANRVNVRSDSLQLVGLQRGSTIWRHRAADRLRLSYALRDGLRDAVEATVTPKPSSFDEIGANRAAASVRTMASTASAIGDLAVEDSIAECDLIFRGTWGRREGRSLTTSVRVHTLGRKF
jgi:hypothetical protein